MFLKLLQMKYKIIIVLNYKNKQPVQVIAYYFFGQ